MVTTRTCVDCGTHFDGQFCPQCGAWADPLEDSVDEEFVLGEVDDEEPVPYTYAPPPVACPSCGTANPPSNLHCEECGARLGSSNLPVAPKPLSASSAGSRALVALVAVVVVVALLAFLFQWLGGDDSADTTEASPTTTLATLEDRGAPRQLSVFNASTSSELNERWGAANLIDGTEAAWNDASLGGEDAEMVFEFAEPVEIQWITVSHYKDDERYFRNHRVRGYEIIADDMPDQVRPGQLENVPGEQRIIFQSVRTTRLTIRVITTWPGEPVGELPPYPELAVEEVEFWGLPAAPLPQSEG